MAKTPAAVYAQLRRDNENDVREDVRKLVPEEYFTDELKSNGDYNLSTKVFVAVRSYIQHVQADDQDPDPIDNSKPRTDQDPSTAVPFTIPPKRDSNKPMSEQLEQLRQLRQVAARLVQKAEEKCQAEGGTSKELEEFLNDSADTMIDMIEAIAKM